MTLSKREVLLCLSEVVAMEGDVPIQVTSTEALARKIDLLRGGLFGDQREVDLDQLFAGADEYINHIENAIGISDETTEAIHCVNYAMEHAGTPTLSMEDAELADDAMGTFGVDMESLKESVYDFYRKVRAFLLNIWRKATRLMDIMYRNVQRLKKEAESLMERCRNVGYNGNVGGMFIAPSVAIISYKGRANAASVLEGLLKTASIYDEAINVSTNAANAYYPKITDVVNNVSRYGDMSDKAAAAFTTIDGLASHYDYRSEPITGGYIYVGYADRNQRGFRAGFKIERLEQYYQGIEPSVPVPTIKELQNICAQVIKLCDKIAWGRARYRTIRTSHNAALDTIDTLVNKIQRGMVKDIVKTDSVVSQLTRLITDSITAPIQQLNTIVYRAATGAMLYTDRAIKHIETNS